MCVVVYRRRSAAALRIACNASCEPVQLVQIGVAGSRCRRAVHARAWHSPIDVSCQRRAGRAKRAACGPCDTRNTRQRLAALARTEPCRRLVRAARQTAALRHVRGARSVALMRSTCQSRRLCPLALTPAHTISRQPLARPGRAQAHGQVRPAHTLMQVVRLALEAVRPDKTIV